MKTPPREDVRRQLLCAGHAVVAERGHEAISVRQLAQHVGVSSGAPYHHFPDRRAILVAIALEGFARLEQQAAAVSVHSGRAPSLILTDLGNTFLEFCAENPRLVELMYESEITRPVDEALRPAYKAGFEIIVNVVRQAHPTMETSAVWIRAVGFWSMLFGLSRLLRDRLLDPFLDGDVDALWPSLLISDAAKSAAREAAD